MVVIKDKSDCCGCSACASICTHKAISMQSDDEGFLYPVVNTNKCINCGLCIQTCPISIRKQTSRTNSFRNIYALRSKSDNILFNSSSGGFFYTIATHILKNGGVVVGAAYDERFNVRHTIAYTTQQLTSLMGSKYVQSEIRETYLLTQKELDLGHTVLFSGTPCQIHGLKQFLRKDYQNLITIDVLCHAVPSPLMFKEYLKLAEKKGIKGIVDINMRNKKYVGWNPATSWGVKLKNGTYSVNDSRIINWSRLFFSELMSRPSCHRCQYTNLDRVGDFSLGDYWDRQHHHDELYNKKGTSLVFINSNKAANLFNEINNSLTFFEIKSEECPQQCLIEPAVMNSQRDLYWNLYREQGFEACYNTYFIDLHNKLKPSITRDRLIQKLKDFVTPGPWKFAEDYNRSLAVRTFRKIKKVFHLLRSYKQIA